ncbi:hypothetical protein D9M72_516410 [compost metagenome]
MGTLQPSLLGHAGHAAVFAQQVVFEVGALEQVARFTQRHVEGELHLGLGHARGAAVGGGLGGGLGHGVGQTGFGRRRRDGRGGGGRAAARAFDAAGQALLDRGQQLLQCDRLLKEIERADLGRLDRRVDGGVARHHDDGHRQLSLRGPFLEQGHAIGIGHPDIEQHEVGRTRRAVFARLQRVLREFNHVAFVAEDLREQFPDSHFVIDYEDRCHTSPLNPTAAFRDRTPLLTMSV